MGHCCSRPDNAGFRRNLEDFGTLDLKSESKSYLGYLSRSLEDSGAESHGNYGDPAQEISEGTKSSNWTRGHSYAVPTKPVATFGSLPKHLPEAKR